MVITKALGPNDFLSYTTKQVWTILPNVHVGYVAVCDVLALTVEGDTIGECQSIVEEAEQLLLDELNDDNMTIEEYIAALDMSNFPNKDTVRMRG